jgi:hypothetical protein
MSDRIPGGGFTVARKIFHSQIWLKDPLYLKIWIWIIGRASYEDHEKRGRYYKRGEFVTTYDEIIRANDHYHNRRHIFPTLKQIRIILAWLQSEGMILVKPLKQEPCRTGANTTARTRAYIGLKITVLNYSIYQDLDNYTRADTGADTCSELGQYNKKGKRKVKKKYTSDSIEIGLSKLLLDLILTRNPEFKKPDLQKWALHIGRAIRLDNRTPDGLKIVIEWCQSHSFWQNRILSTEKLRIQFDQLFMQMGGSNNKIKPLDLERINDN